MATDNGASGNQVGYWQQMMQQLAGSAGIGDVPLMAAAGSITADFIQDPNAYQVYQLGNSIPAWSPVWDGSYSQDFFHMYESFISAIAALPAGSVTPEQNQQIAALNSQISDLTQMDPSEKKQLAQYITENCLKTAADGSCAEWLPGTGMTQFAEFWQKYKLTPEYKAQAAALGDANAQQLEALQSQLNQHMLQAYGSEYQQILEAQTAVRKADPHSPEGSGHGSDLAQYQMTVTGVSVPVPRYVLGDSPAELAQWLQEAQEQSRTGQGGNPVTVEFDSTTQTDVESQWQLSGGATVPVDGPFMVNVSAQAGGTQQDLTDVEFSGTLTYQSVKLVSIQPSPAWYNETLITLYPKPQWPVGSPFQGKQLWGPGGVFALRVAGAVVAYQPGVEVTVTNWEQSRVASEWSASASFSIFGLVNLGSGSAGSSSSNTQYTSTSQGFKLVDTSNQPKIIALVVEKLNPPPADPSAG